MEELQQSVEELLLRENLAVIPTEEETATVRVRNLDPQRGPSYLAPLLPLTQPLPYFLS